jgi:hypothetical protein
MLFKVSEESALKCFERPRTFLTTYQRLVIVQPPSTILNKSFSIKLVESTTLVEEQFISFKVSDLKEIISFLNTSLLLLDST